MPDPAVRLLIADAATVPRPAATSRHHHAFWQLDHCDGGSITAILPSGIVRLRRHQAHLLQQSPRNHRNPLNSRG